MKIKVPTVVGLGSLLTIFAVLCLCIFAVLTVATVQSDARLSDNASRAVEQYYAADCCAQQLLAQLRAGEMPDGVTAENGVYTYYCAISDTQALYVQVAINEDNYEILRYQAVSTTDWQADDKLHVWSGPEQ